MNILYDISVFENYFQPAYRTGVFRVAECILQEMLSIEDCQIDFCATLSVSALNHVQDYLQQHPQFPAEQLLNSPVQRWFAALLWPQVARIGQKTHRHWRDRAIRKFFFQTAQWIEQAHPSVNFRSLQKYDIFHSFFYAFPAVTQAIPALQRFLTVYDLIPILFPQYFQEGKQHPLVSILAKLTPRDWVLCISTATRNDLCNYAKHLDPERVLVTPLAASEQFYPCHDPTQLRQIRHKYQIPIDAPYLLSLGTFEPRKNLAHLIHCFAHLLTQENISDLCLVLVGAEGWFYEPIFAELQKLSLQPNWRQRVILTGFAPDVDLAALYGGAIGFVYPSFYEGFGLPPLEAMQCGLPVITSNTSSLPEVVGEAGIMVDPSDGDALCQAMLKLYEDKELRQKMAIASQQQAQKFSWQRTAQQTLQAYQLALQS